MGKHVLPATAHRVRLHTDHDINQKIQARTKENINAYKNKSKEEISDRIEVLNREWDTERALETNAAFLILISAVIGYATGRGGWLIFIGVISAFLLQHALQGWCPPLPIFRRLGIRTASEIDTEKFYLKYLRGDFQDQDPFDPS